MRTRVVLSALLTTIYRVNKFVQMDVPGGKKVYYNIYLISPTIEVEKAAKTPRNIDRVYNVHLMP